MIKESEETAPEVPSHQQRMNSFWKPFRPLALALLGLALVAIYSYLCDRAGTTLNFSQRAKAFHVEISIFALVLAGVAFSSTFRQNAEQCNDCASGLDVPLLSRAQTDEWKGWMQTFLLFYHYLYPAPQPLPIYIAARICVSCFLFMTGYGQTMKALLGRERFEATVLFATILRLNLLVCFLAFAMGRSYADYYYTPLVTFWSALIYVIHTAGSRIPPFARLGLALAASALLSFNSARDPKLPSFARELFRPVSWLVSSPLTPLDTWLFRFQLDCYSPLLGSAAAIYGRRVCDAASSFYAEGTIGTLGRIQRRALGAAFLVAATATSWAMLSPLGELPALAERLAAECAADCDSCPKCVACRSAAGGAQTAAEATGCMAERYGQEAYNEGHHRRAAAVATLLYLAARNAAAPLRRRASAAAAFLGRRSLELYALQYHVWLAAGARRILVAVPASPLVNAVVIFAAFLAAAHAARACTSAAVDAAVPLAAAAAARARRRMPRCCGGGAVRPAAAVAMGETS